MTNEIQSAFGLELKEARNRLGLDQTAVAKQLHLNEKIIQQLEEGNYPESLPLAFLKGYLTSYSKLVKASEKNLQLILNELNQINVVEKDIIIEKEASLFELKENKIIQILTGLVVTAILSLLFIWWYSLHFSSKKTQYSYAVKKIDNELLISQFKSHLQSSQKQKIEPNTLSPTPPVEKKFFASKTYDRNKNQNEGFVDESEVY